MSPTKSKLGNPVVAATLVQQGASALPFVIKMLFVTGLAVVGYNLYTNRFKEFKENSSLAPANVSFAQAKGRADSIGKSIGLVSNDFENVSKQLAGLNYNGFVRVYNAFGQQRGTLLGGDLNLIEWIENQFNSYQKEQLSFLLGGAFF
jgi:hypothetical protein